MVGVGVALSRSGCVMAKYKRNVKIGSVLRVTTHDQHWIP